MTTLVSVAVTTAFIASGAYFGLCVGQIVSYYGSRYLMRKAMA